MKILKGFPISNGVVEGTVCLYADDSEIKIPHYSIEKKDIPAETAKLDKTLLKTQKIMQKSVQLAKKLLDKKAAEIFGVHLLILKDITLIKRIKDQITSSLVNAEHAVNDVFDEIIADYKKKEAHFAELSQDFLDIKEKILHSFRNSKGSFVCTIGETSQVILASDHLTLDSILSSPDSHILGIIINECGYTSHAAILARSLGIPTLSGINVKEELNCNDKVIIDADKGVLYIHPDQQTQE